VEIVDRTQLVYEPYTFAGMAGVVARELRCDDEINGASGEVLKVE